MKFLIDTNVFIPLEPTMLSDVKGGTHKIVELARLLSEAQHQLYVHPAALSDIQRDSSEGGIIYKEFQAYYAKSVRGVAIGIGRVCVLRNAIPLTKLSNSLVAPQCFLYLPFKSFEKIQEYV